MTYLTILRIFYSIFLIIILEILIKKKKFAFQHIIAT